MACRKERRPRGKRKGAVGTGPLAEKSGINTAAPTKNEKGTVRLNRRRDETTHMSSLHPRRKKVYKGRKAVAIRTRPKKNQKEGD